MIRHDKKTGKFVKTRFDRFCLDCEKPLGPTGYKSRRCSVCAVKDRIKRFPMKRGPKAPRWKTGDHAYRQYIKKKCKICGSKKNLYVHHIDKNRQNNKLSNLQTVCSQCHTKICHKRKFYGNQYIKT